MVYILYNVNITTISFVSQMLMNASKVLMTVLRHVLIPMDLSRVLVILVSLLQLMTQGVMVG